jgi:hypothetical protein
MPAFANTDLGVNEFHHLNPEQRKHFTRDKSRQQSSSISGRPIQDAGVTYPSDGQKLVLSFEEAQDLYLLLPINVFCLSERQPQNPYELVFHASEYKTYI